VLGGARRDVARSARLALAYFMPLRPLSNVLLLGIAAGLTGVGATSIWGAADAAGPSDGAIVISGGASDDGAGAAEAAFAASAA
jgi:hypothetical protein